MNHHFKQKLLLPLCGATILGFTFPLLGQNPSGQTTPPAGQAPSQRTSPNSQTGTQNGQGDRQTNRNNSTSQTERNTNTGTTESALMRAIEMNVAEVQAGKAAESKAQNSRVKSFAQMMVKDHTEALTKLRAIQGAGNTADVKPSTAHQQSIDSMSKMTGAGFDRDYIDMMVKDHQEALTFLEQQSKTGNTNSGSNANTIGSASNSSFAKVAEELIPTVRHHLEEAQSIQKELGGNRNTGNTNTTTAPSPNSSTNTNTNRATPNSPSPNGTPNNPNSTPGTPTR